MLGSKVGTILRIARANVYTQNNAADNSASSSTALACSNSQLALSITPPVNTARALHGGDNTQHVITQR
jgi:hypothetical protein